MSLMASVASFTAQLGAEVEDADEETYLLFANAASVSSNSLGFIDPAARRLELTVAGRDLVIHQSPAVLASSRLGGTTGAVAWKVTPLFAEWIASPDNILSLAGVINQDSIVLELGCGISAVVGLVLSRLVSLVVLTDQPYVSRLVDQNLQENRALFPPSASGGSARHQRHRLQRKRQSRGGTAPPSPQASSAVRFEPLDWETDEVSPSLTGSADVKNFDVVIACDCVYNEALIDPFVQTCVDVCGLRALDPAADAGAAGHARPCVCVVANQLRTPEVFEHWLTRFHSSFHVWRVPEQALPLGLQSGSGFAVHIGILRDSR